ncbi:iron chelate uptake ABC transporter family permease subunit [Flavobacteriaceae bacterium Ap0902]|nr:iron chelate uptake ABC transporter family permease subunit [Flavobacteriaceae bacterium Ap0902]
MISAQIEIQLIAVLVSVACALLGVFLVLRKMALISDAISHSILPGIVIGFFITQDLNSPLLIILAAAAGMLTVLLVEWVQQTNLVKEDTAIGIVFPALFAIGIIMIAKNAGDVHLDVDAVLLGELAFAPFNRWMVNGTDLGPKAAWVMGVILLIVGLIIKLFYKELKVSSFDAGLASSLGFSPLVIHYGLMFLSSVTIVGAFDAVGAVLVVGFMIVPASIAYLWTNRLNVMIWLAVLVGASSSILGYWVAHWLDASIAGSIMAVMGVFFAIAYLFSPEHGRIIQKIRRNQRREEISLLTLLIHVQSHESLSERSIEHLQEHINWSEVKANKILKIAKQKKLIEIKNGVIHITLDGISFNKAKTESYLV